MIFLIKVTFNTSSVLSEQKHEKDQPNIRVRFAQITFTAQTRQTSAV